MKYSQKPFIAIWETTQACDLQCKHCRAEAQPLRDSAELTTAEACRLFDSFARAKVPLVVLTGGDPAKRPDLVELIAHGKQQGLTMALTPSATPLVTRPLLVELCAAGLSRLAVSIDGPEPTTHDAFRGVPGSFDWAMKILRSARELGLKTQVNSTVHIGSINDLDAMARLVEQVGAVLWSVFFVVPTGRAQVAMLPSADDVEAALQHLHDLAKAAKFAVKTTAAPHYRRILLERNKLGSQRIQHGVNGGKGLRVNDGRGFLFVSHRGQVYPSGFLPVPCGNVRERDPIDIYRNHHVFQSLRRLDGLKGKCGACEYRHVCGGSRARAYAMIGDMLASDPLCAFVPKDWSGEVETSQHRHLVLAPT